MKFLLIVTKESVTNRNHKNNKHDMIYTENRRKKEKEKTKKKTGIKQL